MLFTLTPVESHPTLEELSKFTVVHASGFAKFMATNCSLSAHVSERYRELTVVFTVGISPTTPSIVAVA